MNDANKLPYYPRFIFNCSDDRCLSTDDLNYLKFIKEKDSKYEITRFYKGQLIEITWQEGANSLVKEYEVSEVKVMQIKYDLDEPTYGINSEDCTSVFSDGQKKWLMEIYVFLNAL